MYRPEITVVDCTIRDGGLMNNSKFPFETVRAVYKAVC
jgi:4-hydroxy 2-oxovalerate aldolase